MWSHNSISLLLQLFSGKLAQANAGPKHLFCRSLLLIAIHSIFLGQEKSLYRYQWRAFLLVWLQIDSRRWIKLKNIWNFKCLTFDFNSVKRRCFHHLLFPLYAATLSGTGFVPRNASYIFPHVLTLLSHPPLTLASVSFKSIEIVVISLLSVIHALHHRGLWAGHREWLREGTTLQSCYHVGLWDITESW